MNLAHVGAELATRLPGQVALDGPSAPLTTYRCGGPLAVLVRVERDSDVRVVGEVCGQSETLPLLVVGRGSNLLVADRGFAGVALQLAGEFERLEIDRDRVHVHAGGAVALPVLARRAAAAGAGGLEFFVGIPGSVGGSVRMNAGGHGRETKDVLVRARVASLVHVGAPEWRTLADLDLGFRRSNLLPSDVVLGAELRAEPDDSGACAARIDDIVRWRREHQPGGQNAGSVFKNPPGDAAGRIIDACGLKGLRIGGAVVSEKHANFFVADPGATASDVYALVREVQRRVEVSTGVRLEPEVQLVGFATTAADAVAVPREAEP